MNRSGSRCTLCNLPNPSSPITEKGVHGRFCCMGCLHVYQLLEELDNDQANEFREETISRRNNKNETKQEKSKKIGEELFLKVEGMHCTTCESFLEAMTEKQDGILLSEASYANEMMKICYDPEKYKEADLPDIISRMGYQAYPVDKITTDYPKESVTRLVIGGFFGIMGLLLYTLFLYPAYLYGQGIVPLTFNEQSFIIGNLFVMTSFVFFYTGLPILRGAWVSLSVGQPNMDLLISIAAGSAYLYSIGAFITGASEVYFDVTMAIILVVSLGNHYEQKIKSSKNTLLQKLTENRISQASVRRNGKIEELDISNLQPGDLVLVRAGERIPVDGTIEEGQGTVNEALVTGESLPVNKKAGERVLSGTLLESNSLWVRADAELQSTLDNLVRLMWEIQSSRHSAQRLADKIAAFFIPGVILVGTGTFIYHIIGSGNITSALLTSLAVLIVSCPCALGLATPLAIASGFREALRQNIVIKSGALFEQDKKIKILAFDKTGTLTTGQLQLLDCGTDRDAHTFAVAIEQHSSHPVATAITTSGDLQSNDVQVMNFKSYSEGVSGIIDDLNVYIGKPEWLQENKFEISDSQWNTIKRNRKMARIPVGVAWNGKVQSILVVGDRIRPETPAFIRSLKNSGKKIAVITGDSEQASQALNEKLNPDLLFPGARPESKTEIIKKLKALGGVAMIGDGSNDAPALAESDVGIAFGNLTAIAADSAQIVIPHEKLSSIISALDVIRQTKTRIRQNLGWAFLYNIITIPLAVTGMINPLFAALAMASSSLLVLINSYRKMNLAVS